MNSKTKILAAIQRTERNIAWYARTIVCLSPNEFGKYPVSKEMLQAAIIKLNKYQIILSRLYNILVPKNENVPAKWYARN